MLGLGMALGFIFVVYLGFIGAIDVAEGLSSRGWTQTKAHVISSSSFAPCLDPTEAILSRLGLFYHFELGRTFEVSYRYRVAGTAYSGNRVRYNGIWGFFPPEEQSFPDYKSGESVAVYYNPANPKQAVLKPGAGWGSWVTLILGFLLTVFVIRNVNRTHTETTNVDSLNNSDSDWFW